MSLSGIFNNFFGNSVARNLEEDLNRELDAADFQPRLDSNWKPCSDIKVHPVTGNPTKAWEKIAVKQDVKVIKQLSPKTPIFKNKVRFVCISDTHNRTDRLLVPPGDVLLHSGDYTNVGRSQEVEHFNDFLGTLPHKHKIVIAGNHDIPFDPAFLESDTKGCQWGLKMPEIRDYLESKGCKSMKGLLTNCTYIEDSEISVYGIRIWGSPCPGLVAGLSTWREDRHAWTIGTRYPRALTYL